MAICDLKDDFYRFDYSTTNYFSFKSEIDYNPIRSRRGYTARFASGAIETPPYGVSEFKISVKYANSRRRNLFAFFFL